MENRRLALVKKTKRRKLHKWLFWLCFLLMIGLGAACVVTEFSVKNIEVSGCQTYTEGEVLRKVKSRDYVPNTLLMIAQNRIFGQRYLPFVEKMTMSLGDSHTLKIHVTEKLRAGVFEYMGKYVYFDSDGIAQESRNYRFSGVPLVTGVKFDEMIPGKKIPAEGNYYDTILSITQNIATYGLDISEIHFENENDITLKSGKYAVYLGTSAYLDGKMSKIPEVLDAIAEKSKKGSVDMHLYTDEKPIITYSAAR